MAAGDNERQLTAEGYERIVATTEHDAVIRQVVGKIDPAVPGGKSEALWDERVIYGDDDVEHESAFVKGHVTHARKHAKHKMHRPKQHRVVDEESWKTVEIGE